MAPCDMQEFVSEAASAVCACACVWVCCSVERDRKDVLCRRMSGQAGETYIQSGQPTGNSCNLCLTIAPSMFDQMTNVGGNLDPKCDELEVDPGTYRMEITIFGHSY